MLQQFILRFTGALNRRRAYAVTHPMVRDAEVALLEATVAALSTRVVLSIGVARHELLIDGERCEARGASELAARLHRCGVGALRIESGVTLEDLREALGWLALDPEATTHALPPHGNVHITRTAYDHLVLHDAIRSANDAVASLWRTLASVAGVGPAATPATGTVAIVGDTSLRADAADVSEQPVEDHAQPRDTGNVDPGKITAALRSAIQQPAVAHRSAAALIELTKSAGTTSDVARAMVGRELASLLEQLGDDAFAPLVRSLSEQSQRQRFVTDLVDALPLRAAPAWLSAAAVACERPMSQHLLRLMTKLSALADDRGDVGTEATFRDATHDLVSGWTLDDPNPDHHVELLDRIAACERGASAEPRLSGPTKKSVVESVRLLQMALELDCCGEDTVAAAEALTAAGSGRTILSWLDGAPDTPTARWLRSVATSERAVKQLLLTEPVDRLDARALLELLDASYTETLLDVLAEASTRGTRLIVRQRLAEFGSVITPQLLVRLDDAPWYMVRNILTLLHDVASSDAGTGVGSETMMRLLDHAQVQVRVEALRLLLLMDERARSEAIRRALDDENDRVTQVAIDAIMELATGTASLPAALQAQLRTLVDTGVRSDSLRARAVRALAPIRDGAIRDWLVGIVTRRTRILRRLVLNEPSQTAAAALQVLLRGYPEDQSVRAVAALAARDARDPRWSARDPAMLSEHVA